MLRSLMLVLTLGVVLALGAANAEEVYLHADFNDKTIDAPIGTGGPEVGEPFKVDTLYIDTAVRAAPFPTPCLELIDDSDYYAGSVDFHFLGGAEYSSGRLVVCADFWIPASPPSSTYSLYLREGDGATHNFGALSFALDGQIGLTDAGGPLGHIGTYETQERIHACFDYDLDAGTYDVRVDDELLIADQPHDVTGAGIGRVYVSNGSDTDTGDSFYVDNIYVGDEWPTPAENSTWGALKERFQR